MLPPRQVRDLDVHGARLRDRGLLPPAPRLPRPPGHMGGRRGVRQRGPATGGMDLEDFFSFEKRPNLSIYRTDFDEIGFVGKLRTRAFQRI